MPQAHPRSWQASSSHDTLRPRSGWPETDSLISSLLSPAIQESLPTVEPASQEIGYAIPDPLDLEAVDLDRGDDWQDLGNLPIFETGPTSFSIERARQP